MYKINNDEIKIIISDFDGTLRPYEKNKHPLGIPQQVINELQIAIKSGCYFILNTGNLPYEMKASVELLGSIKEETKYIIASNGNAIGNYLTGKTEIGPAFTKKELLKFIKIFDQIEDSNYDITSTDMEYIYYKNSWYKDYMIGLGLNKVDKDHRLDLTNNILESFGNCPKITYHNLDSNNKKSFISTINKNFSDLKIHTTWFTDTGVDFQIEGETKFTAILKVLEKINQETNQNWGLNNVIYFGDHHNDLPVFQNLKYSIAMGNAIEEIKEIAYDITTDSSDGGVEFYLKKIKI